MTKEYILRHRCSKALSKILFLRKAWINRILFNRESSRKEWTIGIRYELEIIYYFTYFSTVVPSNICVFLSCKPFVNATFSTGLMGVEVTSVSRLGQLTVDNVVITTKGLQDRNINILDGTTVENKGKLILTEIFPSVQKHDI